jgi:hypothetical protein
MPGVISLSGSTESEKARELETDYKSYDSVVVYQTDHEVYGPFNYSN